MSNVSSRGTSLFKSSFHINFTFASIFSTLSNLFISSFGVDVSMTSQLKSQMYFSIVIPLFCCRSTRFVKSNLIFIGQIRYEVSSLFSNAPILSKFSFTSLSLSNSKIFQ
ncbi:MAG: hypothetical protein LBC61_01440 [Candidatus Peribacteria bacterium]|nr:hypothetical protein [Candidatus Peribacteria bacterium]